MKIEITLPENIKDITLDQFQRFDKLTKREDLTEIEYNKRAIKIFTGLKYDEVGKISHKDYKEIIEQISKAINEESKFERRFNIEGVEFGFIPNFDDITTAEFVDLSEHGLDVENFHKIMAILFRPIIKKDRFNNYEIASYNGTKEYADIMKRMPMNAVNGSFVFFYHLSKELKIHTQKSTNQQIAKGKKQNGTLKNGAGILA